MANFNLDGFTNEVVIDNGLIQPVALGFLPDNRMLVLEKNGKISIADPSSGEKETYLDISGIVNSGGERGLLEIAIPPDFDPSTDGKNQIYLFYTRSEIPGGEDNGAGRAVIGSFVHRERSGGLSSRANINSEEILWTDTDGYVSCCHYGGGLDFGPDGKLWLTSSDKFNTSNGGEGEGDDEWTVDVEHTSGKIIRINRDGTIPNGKDGWPANPYVDGKIDGPYPDRASDGQPFQPHPSIWAYGLRNPFRADWDEKYGNFYIGEVGGKQNLSADDIHIASLDQRGAFYGWNFYEGVNNDAVFNPNKKNFKNPNEFPRADRDLANPRQGDYYSAPIYDVPQFVDDPNGGKRRRSTALVGGFVYRGDMFPDEFDGVYFFANYKRNYIKFLDLDKNGDVVEGVYDFRPSDGIAGKPRDIVFLEQGIDGALYYVNYEGNGGQVQRITYPNGSSNRAPVITSSKVTDNQGNPDDLLGTSVPLNVTYRATVDDADTPLGDLSYRINFGDGTVKRGTPDPVTGAITVNHSYTEEGVYDAVLNVNDGRNSISGRSFEITAGAFDSPPEFQSAEADISFSDPGDSVLFTAVVSDVDDPVRSLTYTLNFGDGTSQVVGSPNAKGEISVRHTYKDNGVYNAFFTISDGDSAPVRSSTISISVGISDQLPDVRGLVFQVEAFTKIGLDGNTVTGWLDQSGFSNDLTAAGNPQLVENATPSGQSAVVLDGKGDYLFREDSDDTRLRGLSDGSGPRTMFFVVDYEDVTNKEFAGLVYGKASNNQAFGLTLDGNDDDLTLHGWGGKVDQKTNIDGVIDPSTGKQRGFISHAVVYDGNRYNHYINGMEIDSGNRKYNTVVEKLLIGQNLNGGETPMSVAAALIYNRALNASELGAVESYIQQTYLSSPSGGNDFPIAVNDPTGGSKALFTTDENTTFTTGNVLSNDSDANGDSLSVSDVDTTTTVGLVSSNGDGTFTYNPNGQFDSLDEGETATDSFAYTVSDGKGGTAVATVTVTIDGVGDAVVNQPPDARNDRYSVTAGQTLSVPISKGLLDNDIDDGALTVTKVNGRSFSNGSKISLANGSLAVNANGSFSYTPDSGFTAVESFTYTVSDGKKTDTASVNITVNSPPPSDGGGNPPPSDGGDLPISNKLVARFESDLNVAEKNGFVTGWRSGGGSNMDLVAVGDPRLVKGATPTGQAAISLDGGRGVYGETGASEGDSLEQTAPGRGLADLPSGNDPRTMYFVVDYKAPNSVYAGVTYGKGQSNKEFGLTLSGNSHRLTVNGVGRKNTFTVRSERGVGNNNGSAGDDWFIQSVRYDGTTLRHYRDDRLIDTDTHKYNTIAEHFFLGKNPRGRGFSSLDVAAVLVYDKELSDSEHEQTIDYLTQKYISASTSSQSSVSVTEQSAPPPIGESEAPTSGDRITDDLIALYTFDEGSGTKVKDTSGKGKAFDLDIDELTGATWEEGALTLTAPTLLASDAPRKLGDSLTGEAVTLEAWLTPDSSNPGSGSVVTFSTKAGKRAKNSALSLSAPSGLSTNERSHLVYTVEESGSAAFYVNGELASTDTVTADFSTLARKYELTLGGGSGSDSGWLGTLDLVAVYSQSFDASEVTQNFLAGPSGTSGLG